ncbi:hypothetical protein L0152_15405 [bacterium]|nr:hypothetical protein [bacterium]
MIALLAEISSLNEKVKNCQADLDSLLQELQKFENAYHMPSQEFFKKFSSGKLPHEADYFEWYAYLDMSKKIVEKIRNLERELGETLEQKLLATA